MKKIWNWYLHLPRTVRFETTGVVLFFLCFIFGQLGRMTLSPTVVLYPHDVIIVLWLVTHLKADKTLVERGWIWLTKHPLTAVTLAWVALGLIWGVINHFQLRPLLMVARLTAYFMFAFQIGQFFKARRVELRLMMVITGIGALWLGLLQYLFIPDTRFLSILGWDDHYYRLIGTLFDPNYMGMFIILVMLYTISLQWLIPKKFMVGLQAIFVGLLAVTYSRASYATAGLTALLLAATPFPLKKWNIHQRVGLGLTVLLTFSLVLYTAPKPGGEGVKLLRTSSIEARQSTTLQTMEALSSIDVIIGRGLFSNLLTSNTDPKVPQHAQVPDNVLVLLLSGTGVIGTVLILASLIYWIGQLAGRETALAIALSATLLHAQFNNTLFEPFISVYLLLALLAPLDQTQMLYTRRHHFRAKPNSHSTKHQEKKSNV